VGMSDGSVAMVLRLFVMDASGSCSGALWYFFGPYVSRG